MGKIGIQEPHHHMETYSKAENFEAEVLRSPLPVLVDFCAEWCMPCHAIAPAISEIAKEYRGKLKVGKLNVDEHPDIAGRYRITSIPNLKVFKNSQIVEEIVGAMPKREIIKRVEKHVS